MRRGFCLRPGPSLRRLRRKLISAPYLIDLETSDVDYPLAQFQMKKWDREGTLGLVRGINGALAEKESKSVIPAANLEKLFEALWPQLEKQYASAPKKNSKPTEATKKSGRNDRGNSGAGSRARKATHPSRAKVGRCEHQHLALVYSNGIPPGGWSRVWRYVAFLASEELFRGPEATRHNKKKLKSRNRCSGSS